MSFTTVPFVFSLAAVGIEAVGRGEIGKVSLRGVEIVKVSLRGVDGLVGDDVDELAVSRRDRRGMDGTTGDEDGDGLRRGSKGRLDGSVVGTSEEGVGEPDGAAPVIAGGVMLRRPLAEGGQRNDETTRGGDGAVRERDGRPWGRGRGAGVVAGIVVVVPVRGVVGVVNLGRGRRKRWLRTVIIPDGNSTR